MNNSNYNILQNYFDLSGDEVFIIDSYGDIQYKNQTAKFLYSGIKNINKLSHIFNFEICILKSDDILTFSPISAAINSKEAFYSAVKKQIKDKIYIEYFLSSIPIEDNKKIIILKNNSNINLQNEYSSFEARISDLEEEILQAGEYKKRLETQLLRTNLINLLSDKVREYIDTKKIIKIMLGELKKTLDIYKADFSENKDIKNEKMYSEFDEKNLVSKLFIPIVKDKISYGTLILYKKNIQNAWQKDELDLLKNVSSLLITSFSKEELYKKLALQKQELETALSQLKDAQLQIIQSEKLATLGQLVAGVAHEINTPLGAILANMDLLDKISKNTSDISEFREFLNHIMPVNNEALNRISKMIKSLKNFTRLDEAKKKKIDITDGIRSSLDLLAHEIKNKITIQLNLNPIPEICCYPDSLNQVFMNIILNACQSIKKQGTITITTEQENNFVKIIIADTGEGISKKNLEKIFDFGYTTKKLGQGTGLGLALSKKIIQEHAGDIKVQSKLGSGSTFTIYLPIKQ